MMRLPWNQLPRLKAAGLLAGALCLICGFASSAWADEDCETRQRQLQRAEENANRAVERALEANDHLQAAQEAEAEAESAYDEERAKTQEAVDALDAAREAEAAARANTSALGKLFNSEEWQAYEAAAEQLEYAERALYHQRNSESRAQRQWHRASDAAGEALEAAFRAGGAVQNALRQLEEARRRAQEPCDKKDEEGPGIEEQVEQILGDSGRQVIQEYAGRARDANTEDIVIDKFESGGGAGGGAGATTNASFNASCDVFAGTGTNTVSVNGTPFCSVTGTAPALSGGTANFTCVPGAAVTVSATCSATTCRVFANAVTNLTCPFPIPGFLSGGFGGGGGFGTSASINCTCQ